MRRIELEVEVINYIKYILFELREDFIRLIINIL